MWIPGAVYEGLPSVYTAAGVMTIAYSSNIFSVVAGLLLITAGGVIWCQRRDWPADGG